MGVSALFAISLLKGVWAVEEHEEDDFESADELMEELDNDGDGFLSLQELVDGIQAEQAGSDDPENKEILKKEEENVKKGFPHADENGDGKLSKEELKTLESLL